MKVAWQIGQGSWRLCTSALKDTKGPGTWSHSFLNQSAISGHFAVSHATEADPLFFFQKWTDGRGKAQVLLDGPCTAHTASGKSECSTNGQG